MSTRDDLYYDVEALYIDGVSAKRIAVLLECSMDEVYAVLEDMGVADAPQQEKVPDFG